MKSIFLALARCSLPQDENYLTEASVFLINSLLANEKIVGIRILNRLCGENGELAFTEDDDIAISTH